MKSIALVACVLAAVLFSPAVNADELTEIIQKDLVALGYDPGNIGGEMTTDTIVAISKFQTENGMEVTGEASPQLAGVIKAKLKEKNSGGAQAAAAAPANDPAALQAAQQSCLEEKIAAVQDSQKKKKGFGSLMRAVTNTAARFGGNSELARQVRETSYDIYNVDATADDWARAAKDLGLSESELEECRNPQM